MKNKTLKNSKILNFKFLILNSHEGGFTLLDLLISIAILGVIILIIGGALRLGARSVESGERKIEYLERIRASLNIIDSQIQSEVPLTYDEDGVKKYYFKGGMDSMQFSTNYSIWSGQRGYVIVTYRVESANYGKQGTPKSLRLFGGPGQVLYASESNIGTNDNRETKLLDTFDRIYFEYFYRDPTEQQGRWIEQWTDATSIPEKIRLHLVKGRMDFSMIIPMRARGLMAQTALTGNRPVGMR